MQAYAIDSLLRNDGQRLTELAAALQLDKSTTSRVVAGMKRHGLVGWSRPAEDRRAISIVVTPEGRRRYEHFRSALIRQNAQLLKSYAPAARRAAISILEQLVQRADS